MPLRSDISPLSQDGPVSTEEKSRSDNTELNPEGLGRKIRALCVFLSSTLDRKMAERSELLGIDGVDSTSGRG